MEVPGPGSYKLPPTDNGRGFSLPKGPRDKKPGFSTDIGPGAYKLPSDNSSRNRSDQGKGAVFNKSPRDLRGKTDELDLVGPGAYKTDISSFHINRGTFPKSKRAEQHNGIDIGPGAYDSAKTDFGKGGYSIAGKPRAHTGDQKPGPGQYDYSKFMDKRDWGHGISLPKAQKREVRPTTDIGPGGYLKDSPGKPSGFSFGKDKKDHEGLMTAPGPGAYQLKAPEPLYNPRSFGKSERGLGKSRSQADQIGPGAYEIKDKYSGGFRFGKDAREHQHDDGIPGPARYNPPKLHPISNLGSFGRQKRAIDKNNEGTNSVAVGPGMYVPKVENWSGGYSIGRGKRVGLASKLETPGVGAYNIKDKHDGGYSFPHAGKPKMTNTTPGFYRPMYTVPDVPNYLLPPEPQRKIHL